MISRKESIAVVFGCNQYGRGENAEFDLGVPSTHDYTPPPFLVAFFSALSPC